MRLSFLLIFWVVGVSGVLGQGVKLVVPVGHTGLVSCAIFSPDEQYVLTGSYDRTAILWDIHGKELQRFSGHEDAITSIAFSPNGQQILTGSLDRTAKLWDRSGREIATFRNQPIEIVYVAFSPEGKHIATCGKDGTVILRDASGSIISRLNNHLGATLRLAVFSPDGKNLLTTGDDQVAILQDLAGNVLQVFSGEWSNLLAACFSSDGNFVFTGNSAGKVTQWNLAGEIVRSMQIGSTFHEFYPCSMAFSADREYILRGNNSGITKMWDWSGREILTFGSIELFNVNSIVCSNKRNFILTGYYKNSASLRDWSGHELISFRGYASTVAHAVFSPDGNQILMGGSNKTALLWDLSGSTVESLAGDGSLIRSLKFSRDGKKLLTGTDRSVQLRDATGGRNEFNPSQAYGAWAMAFSPDGNYFLTAGSDKAPTIWDLSGREVQVFKRAGTVGDVDISPDGKYVLLGSTEKVVLYDLAGNEIRTLLRESGSKSIAFSHDGKSILIANNEAEFLSFGPPNRSLALFDTSGKQLKLIRNQSEGAFSVAFSPDDQSILAGSSDGIARLWNRSGKIIRTFVAHAGPIISVSFSPDGQYILTGSTDRTIKLWSFTTGKELASLFSIDSADWVVTTPSGLFDASPGAMKLLHYVQGLDVIELDQLKERYYEPGLLAKIMGFDPSELRNVAAFDQVALYPEVKASIEKDRLSISLTERSGGMGKISLFINGKEVQEDINPQRLKTLSLDLNTLAKYYQPDTANTLALRAYNAEGWLKSQAYELAYSPASKAASPTSKVKPRLYALVVGTSDYAGERLDLRFADQDATAMATALTGACGALFGADRTEVRLLCTASGVAGGDASNGKSVSSKANIRQAFADIAAKASSADVLVVYFSGHGLAYGPAEKEQFYYLTKDIGSEDLKDPAVREQYTVSSNEFTQWLTAIPAQKQVMILDACNAGKVVESLATLAQKTLDPSQIRALDRMKDRTGMFILTGSAADKVSYEASQYGQGLLTYSLLQGMSGFALTDDKRVDVMRLFQYSRDQVPELAKGIGGVQTPVLAFPTDGSSFDIGIVNMGVKIPVAQVKPVFIRNNFTNDDSFDDNLGLTDALEAHLRKLTLKGAQADLIYVDVKEYDNAFSLKGRYTVAGEAVTVRGKLFKGKDPKGEFQVVGKKGDVTGLVQMILEKVGGML